MIGGKGMIKMRGVGRRAETRTTMFREADG